MSEKTKNKTQNVARYIDLILGGRIFTEKVMSKNILYFVVIVVISMAYIHNRYICISKQKEISRLENRLVSLKYETLTISSKLMGNSREIKVESMIKANGVDLEVNSGPIFTIK